MRRTLLPLAALAALVLFSGVAAAESGDPTELVGLVQELLDSLQALVDALSGSE